MTDDYQTTMFEENWKSILAGLGVGAATLMEPSHSKADTQTNQPAKVVAASTVQTNLPAATTNSVTPANIIAATLIGEAGGEGKNGMQAVLNVIMKRSKNDFEKASGVCLARKQFSMWNGVKDKSKIISKNSHHPKWKEALELVEQAKKGTLQDITKGASSYYAHKKVTPYWASSMDETVVIGNHTFMKPYVKTGK